MDDNKQVLYTHEFLDFHNYEDGRSGVFIGVQSKKVVKQGHVKGELSDDHQEWVRAEYAKSLSNLLAAWDLVCEAYRYDKNHMQQAIDARELLAKLPKELLK